MDKEKIVSFLRQKGPSVPNDIKKALGGDTIIFGAILSELISRGKIKITKLKKGSSPFYYLPGQEPMLEKLMEFLNPKDQETVRLLKEQKVIRESEHTLFIRLSLRNIPDFAKEMMLQTKEGPYRFWRYYQINQEEAIKIVNERLNPKPKEEPKPTELKKDLVEKNSLEEQEVIKQTSNSQKQETKNSPEKSNEEPSETNIEKPVEKTIENNKEELIQLKKQTEPKIISETKFTETKKETEKQKPLSIKPSLEKTLFYEKIINYFTTNKIELEHEEQISKDREYSFLIKIPSNIGYLKFYCHARNKKKLNEGDVAPALLNAKTKDLQCLFVTNGEFTKKSLTMMNKEYKGLIIKKI